MRCIAILLSVALLVCSSGKATGAELEFGLDQAHTSNLLKNAGEAAAWYTNPRAALRLYPVPTMEISLTGQYTFYYGLDSGLTELEDLSNFRGGVAVSFIPRQSDDGVSVVMEGRLDHQEYRDAFDEYSNSDGALTVTAGTAPADNLRLRAGGSVRRTAYGNSDDLDRSEYDVFGGLNWTLPGRNVIDGEFGVSLTRATFMTGLFVHRITGDTLSDPSVVQASFLTPTEADDSEALSLLYMSKRFSRPLGDRTGISATVTWRKLPQSGSKTVQGINSDVVSPWSSVWEGYSFSVNIKTFMIPRIILTWGAGYWHREYLPAWEIRAEQRGSVMVDFWTFVERVDNQRRTYVSVERPCSVAGSILRLSVSVDYTSNSSNHILYDYEDVTAAAGVSLTF
jgi:hypothetical protein